VLLIKCYLGDKIRKMRWAGHVTHTGEVRRVLIGKSEEKRSIGKLRRRWEHSIQTDFQEIR
jgi:hypothetical protein